MLPRLMQDRDALTPFLVMPKLWKPNPLGGIANTEDYIIWVASKLRVLSLISHKIIIFHVQSKHTHCLFFNMPRLAGIANFNPDKDIPSLSGKVVLVTGGMSKVYHLPL